MGLLENITKNKIVSGLAIGIGVSIILPKLLPVLAESSKPLLKTVIKGGLLCFEKGKEIVAELSETTEDLWEEVKMEMEAEHFADLEGKNSEAEEEIRASET